jgi:hypothetical protein
MARGEIGIGRAKANGLLSPAGRVVRAAILITVLTTGVAHVALPAQGSGPALVELSWLSISNVYQRIGSLGVLIDGYITRIPESEFFGGGGGLANTRNAWKPDVPEVTRVLAALGGPTSINLLLTGHSHFDHSFDTGTWSRLTGAPVIGSRTTCLQVRADDVPSSSCTTVVGGERLTLAPGVTMWVVRWNHSGDPAVNPEQHNAVELSQVPARDPATGGLRAGVAEDFPNGGGNRAFLFVVDGPSGRYSWFFQNSASAVDLEVPIVVDGTNYGAPLANLQAAMKDAGLPRVDLWIGSGAAAIAPRVLPVLQPKAFLPVHWDGLYSPFKAGVPAPFRDARLVALLRDARVELLTPTQYGDTWRLDISGIRRVDTGLSRRLGFQ